MMAAKSNYSFVSEPDEARAEYVSNQLLEFNRARQSPLWTNFEEAAAPLEIYALDASGAVVGGLVGETNRIPEWMNISVIWVAEGLRGQGIGSRLMRSAEEQARLRRCRFARLATSDFQAPDFYKKLGYQMYGMLEDCPQGETDFYFFKRLV